MTFPLALAVALVVLGAPYVGEAQRPARAARMGVLTPAFDELGIGSRVRLWLTERGWREGSSLRVEWRQAWGDDTQLDGLAAELVALPVDVIVTSGMLATLAAKRSTPSVPIVFGVEDDPVLAGIVASLARPGGNLTGMTIESPELARKRLQLLTEVMPKRGCVGVLRNPGNRDKDAE